MRNWLWAVPMIGGTVGLLLTGCGGGDPYAVAAGRGAPKFKSVCATCHGLNGKGLPNLGKDLTISQFVKDNSDDELLAFVKTGRPPMDGNAEMPPKGGDPSLSDEQIQDIIAYVRTIEVK